MAVSEQSVGRAGATPDPTRGQIRAGGLDTAVAGLAGLVVLAPGIWTAASSPSSAGSFEIGIGVGLLLAVIWRDALATTLAALLVTSVLYAVDRAADVAEPGPGPGPLTALAVPVVVAVLAGFAFRCRLRRLGHVLGHVNPATERAWGAFVEQKTVVLESYRRDGRAVPTAVSIAVDGDRAVVRSFEKAGKTRRLRRNPEVRITPSNARGTPHGQAIRARARRLDGADARAAARLLRRKYPLLHGVLVPLAHRAGRARTGRTVHFELMTDGPTHDGGDG